jgi:phenolic acid decarboxylase
MVVIIGAQTQIRLQLSDGREDRFPQAVVYDATDAIDDTVDLTHIAAGLYSGNWTPSTTGAHAIVFFVYKDAGHTNEDTSYDRGVDQVHVHTADMSTVSGLVNNNSVMDQQVYNSAGQLTSARLRVYDTEASATAAGATGLLETHTITAAYVAGEQTRYTVVRVGS